MNIDTGKLDDFEEFTGVLEKVEEGHEKMILHCVNKLRLTIPSDLQLKEKLNKNIGKKIGIIKIDTLEKPYLLRVIGVEK